MKAKFVNEAIIQPNKELFNEFKDIFIEVKQSNTNDPFFELNERLNPLGIYLYDYKNYFDQLDPEEKREFQHARMLPELGIRILGFDASTERIFIVCDESFDDKFINTSIHRFEHFFQRMWSSFGHETIHKQQVNKMNVKQNPTFRSKDEYFNNKQEIMAMAFSFIQEMRDFHTDKEIMNLLKTGTHPSSGIMHQFGGMPKEHPLYGIYNNIGGESYKLFIKYAYNYLTDNDNE